jgi:hypothetical protein
MLVDAFTDQSATLRRSFTIDVALWRFCTS